MESPSVEANEQPSSVHSLYRREIARFRFEPTERLEGALRTLFAKDAGPRALFLYSPYQEFYERTNTKSSLSEINILSEAVDARTRCLKSSPNKLARYVGAIQQPEEVGFEFSIPLTVATMEKLHACLAEGLKQSTFGRNVLEATLWVRYDDLVEPEHRKLAFETVKQAAWGSEDVSVPADRFNPPHYNAAIVKGMSWQRSSNSRH